MAQKPSIPKGTRDLLPTDVYRRNYIFNTIRNAFKKYGFEPIETPSFELSSTLLGKYGDEGDRLVFRILNSGEKVFKANVKALEDGNARKFVDSIAEKALRYDLTVPLARFVVQHQHELTFPFKRYQIQPVWRADRPQKGRYQEFYQCDADIVGSDSLLHEIDLVLLFDEVLSNLKIPDFIIKVNNRKVLSGIAEVCGIPDRIVAFTVALDKLDKIGREGVINEMAAKGFSEIDIGKLLPILDFTGSNEEKLNQLDGFLANSNIGKEGIRELRFVLSRLGELNPLNGTIEFDITLARGLNYYTGAIFEVKTNSVAIGSICGGGRYDDLTGLFGLKGLSGIGISFGADRIYDVLEELNLFPSNINEVPKVLVLNFGEEEQITCLRLVMDIRNIGIACDYYPTNAKIQKQFKYANERGYPYVLVIGEYERLNHEVKLKNMASGEQLTMKMKDISVELKRLVNTNHE
jgi:histidyl-tRNA synthetase